MKKNLIISIFIVTIAVISFIIYTLLPTNLDKLPKFSYINLNNEIIDNNSIISERPLIIYYFSTECSHCHRIIKKMKSYNYDKNYKIIYITPDESKNVENFIINNHLQDTSKKDFLLDKKNSFQSDFSLGFIVSYPTILFFDSSGKLIKKEYEL